MNTKQAMEALLEGKKVKSTRWNKGQYIVLTSDGSVVDEEENLYKVENTTYELYEEPKTAVLYEWLLQLNNGEWIIVDSLYTEQNANIQFTKNGYKSWQKTGRSFEMEL